MNYNLSTTEIALVVIAVLWEITWKGFALWRASRNSQLDWFIALLVINSVGLLPIIYLLTHKDLSKQNKGE